VSQCEQFKISAQCLVVDEMNQCVMFDSKQKNLKPQTTHNTFSKSSIENKV